MPRDDLKERSIQYPSSERCYPEGYPDVEIYYYSPRAFSQKTWIWRISRLIIVVSADLAWHPNLERHWARGFDPAA